MYSLLLELRLTPYFAPVYMYSIDNANEMLYCIKEAWIHVSSLKSGFLLTNILQVLLFSAGTQILQYSAKPHLFFQSHRLRVTYFLKCFVVQGS